MARGDGHVYAFDPAEINGTHNGKDTRMYAYASTTSDGVPLWQYPKASVALDPIEYTGALTSPASSSDRQYIYSAGGRVYGINIASLDTTESIPKATLRWVYPFANPEAAATTDIAAKDLAFTSPVWRSSVTGLNSGNEVVYAANQDGTLYALDSSVGLASPSATTDLWEDFGSFGATRSSPVFVTNMIANVSSATTGPAILMPYDIGALIGLKATTGAAVWEFFDGDTGAVPVTDTSGNATTMMTSYVFRGADAITANGFVYNGDEGLLDTGEVNGQFHVYADTSLTGGGAFVPGEPGSSGQANRRFDFRSADLVLDTTYDSVVGGSMSGKDAMASGKTKTNATDGSTDLGTVLYEWGDTVRAVAWGAYSQDSTPPTAVQFRMTGHGATRTVTATVKRDTQNTDSALQVVLADGSKVAAYAWVATVAIPLNLPSEQDPQTPGSEYRVTVQVQNATGARTFYRQVGERLDEDGTALTGSAARSLSIAHPFALSTAGAPTTAALGGSNIIGWITSASTANAYRELLANGNVLSALTGSTVTASTARDLYAPIGAVAHGTTATYAAVSGSRRVPGLYVADRSNLYKINQRLKNIRVDRGDLAWGWNASAVTAAQKLTGNVMNPLPWESFPTQSPNVSRDYPNIDRRHASFRVSGTDMAVSGATLTPRSSSGAMTPAQIDLTVSVPKYQPANINAWYYNINSIVAQTGYAPMVLGSSGGAPATSGSGIFPSAGYVGAYRIYYAGAKEAFDKRYAYREMRAGVAVPPDLSFHVTEDTVDLGVAPHGLGYAPIANKTGSSAPFAPTGPVLTSSSAPAAYGPYGTGISPFDPLTSSGLPAFFAPFTIVSESNVNLVNLRIAKIIGTASTASNPSWWLRLSSDEVKSPTGAELLQPMGVGQIFAPSVFPLSNGAGNIGITSTLDHALPTMTGTTTTAHSLEMNYVSKYGSARPNFWPWASVDTPYVAASPSAVLSALGWVYSSANCQPRPTLHKPRPDDPAGTILTMPDVAYGDPEGVLAASTDRRPKIGVAVPLGTPVGTYSAPITVFEDWYPKQWRDWVGSSGPLGLAVDDDDVLNVNQTAANTPAPVEATSSKPFQLRITVREARLTNNIERASTSSVVRPIAGIQSDGTYLQADARAPGQNPLGANLQPTAWRPRWTATTGGGEMVVYWVTNRRTATAPTGGDPWAQPSIQNSPWLLTGSRLVPAIDVTRTYGTVPDWQLSAAADRWWTANTSTPFPTADVDTVAGLFPSDPTTSGGAPTVPGEPILSTVRHTEPAIAADLSGPWLFWQGEVQKSGATGSQAGIAVDTRTFYQQLNAATGVPTGSVFSFANDPTMPKFGPKPLLPQPGSPDFAYLIWYGGASGRSRLYYNVKSLSSSSMPASGGWSTDSAIATPGALQWVSNPVPIWRKVAYVDDSGAAQSIQAVDLIYTGTIKERSQAETFLTRYQVDANDGTLAAIPLPHVDSEVLARDGANQTWLARGIAWKYQANNAYVTSQTQYHPIVIAVVRSGGTLVSPVNVGEPTYDSATNRLYYQSALGGQLYVNPQTGSVTFPDVAPGSTDLILAEYTPRALRLNATTVAPSLYLSLQSQGSTVLNQTQIASLRATQSSIAASGANSGPMAFLDTATNPRTAALKPSGTVKLARLWLFYRKSGAGIAASGAIYYKTMRLMVQLPTAIKAAVNSSGVYTGVDYVTVSGNTQPVEVDWVRGRIYFCEPDEGSIVTVTYTDTAGTSHSNLTYRVQWADEMITGVSTGQTATETALPTTDDGE